MEDLFDDSFDLRPLGGLLGNYVVSRRLDDGHYLFRHQITGRVIRVARASAEEIYETCHDPVFTFGMLLRFLTCSQCGEPLVDEHTECECAGVVLDGRDHAGARDCWWESPAS